MAEIGLVVTIGILQEKHVARFGYHDASIDEYQRGGEVQLIRKDREPVSPAVSVRVLTNLDVGLARLAFSHQTMGIITRLDNPGPSPLIPRHVDGLHDIGFGRKELQIEIRRHLRVPHAVLRFKGTLQWNRLRTALVIRHFPRQTPQRRTRGKGGLPFGPGLPADGLENRRAQDPIRRRLLIREFDMSVACPLETVEHLPLRSTERGVRHCLHHRIKMFQIGVRQMGDISPMIKIDGLGCQSLAGQINVVGTRTTEGTTTNPAAIADRAQIQNMEGTIRCIRRKRIEGDQPSRHESQKPFQFLHSKIKGVHSMEWDFLSSSVVAPDEIGRSLHTIAKTRIRIRTNRGPRQLRCPREPYCSVVLKISWAKL